MTFPDLSPFAPDDSLVAIGWLEDDLPHGNSGVTAPDDVIDTLVRVHRAETPQFLPTCFGYHPCGLCEHARPRTETRFRYKGRELILGSGELLIPASGFIYVAPNLILHYIVDHCYRPPPEFLSATLRCPDPDSRRYRDAVRDNGPAYFRWDIDDPERPLWRRLLRPLALRERLGQSQTGRRLVRVVRAL